MGYPSGSPGWVLLKGRESLRAWLLREWMEGLLREWWGFVNLPEISLLGYPYLPYFFPPLSIARLGANGRQPLYIGIPFGANGPPLP